MKKIVCVRCKSFVKAEDYSGKMTVHYTTCEECRRKKPPEAVKEYLRKNRPPGGWGEGVSDGN